MANKAPHRLKGPQRIAGPFLEYGIVIGLSLIVLFVVIPAGTQQMQNFGLSPRMVPTITVSAIALFALAGLIGGLRKDVEEIPVENAGLSGVIYLVVATAAGIAAVHVLGLVAGGTIIVLLASLALGVRGPVQLGLSAGFAALLMTFVEWSGL